MSQELLWWVLAGAVALAFMLYPALMWRMLASLLRGIGSVLADLVALLLAWI